MSDTEVSDVIGGLRYEDAKTDEEMKKFIGDIISCITTGDEEEDMKSIATFAATIAAQ